MMLIEWQSALYHVDRLPGTNSFSFMWAVPNMIPLPPATLHKMWQAIKPFDFESTFGGFETWVQLLGRLDLNHADHIAVSSLSYHLRLMFS